MKAMDLQIRIANLVPRETLLLLMAEVEEAFHYYVTLEERRNAAATLAELYQCSFTVCGPGESQILVTRHEHQSPRKIAYSQ